MLMMHLTVHFYKEKANIENSTIKYIPESGGTPRSFWIQTADLGLDWWHL
jgi:hypothetical protein